MGAKLRNYTLSCCTKQEKNFFRTGEAGVFHLFRQPSAHYLFILRTPTFRPPHTVR